MDVQNYNFPINFLKTVFFGPKFCIFGRTYFLDKFPTVQNLAPPPSVTMPLILANLHIVTLMVNCSQQLLPGETTERATAAAKLSASILRRKATLLKLFLLLFLRRLSKMLNVYSSTPNGRGALEARLFNASHVIIIIIIITFVELNFRSVQER